jgi:hypothetical protein
LSARAAARRIEPIDEPIKTFRNRWPRGKFHRVGEFSKIGMIVEPNLRLPESTQGSNNTPTKKAALLVSGGS